MNLRFCFFLCNLVKKRLGEKQFFGAAFLVIWRYLDQIYPPWNFSNLPCWTWKWMVGPESGMMQTDRCELCSKTIDHHQLSTVWIPWIPSWKLTYPIPHFWVDDFPNFPCPGFSFNSLEGFEGLALWKHDMTWDHQGDGQVVDLIESMANWSCQNLELGDAGAPRWCIKKGNSRWFLLVDFGGFILLKHQKCVAACLHTGKLTWNPKIGGL